jgi:hypothetical protein
MILIAGLANGFAFDQCPSFVFYSTMGEEQGVCYDGFGDGGSLACAVWVNACQ